MLPGTVGTLNSEQTAEIHQMMYSCILIKKGTKEDDNIVDDDSGLFVTTLNYDQVRTILLNCDRKKFH